MSFAEQFSQSFCWSQACCHRASLEFLEAQTSASLSGLSAEGSTMKCDLASLPGWGIKTSEGWQQDDDIRSLESSSAECQSNLLVPCFPELV